MTSRDYASYVAQRTFNGKDSPDGLRTITRATGSRKPSLAGRRGGRWKGESEISSMR